VTAAQFPEPDSSAIAISRELVRRVGAAVDAAGGWLGFERFMQMALYEPGLGYYSAGSGKLGAAGDFTTAPELGDWFGEAVAALLGPRLAALDSTCLLELGAGSGRLAAQLMAGLQRRGLPAIDYAILEPSADFRQRQQGALAGADAAGSVRWLDRLPDRPLRGFIVANEVADALPVARFVKRAGQIRPLGICRAGAGLALVPGDPDPAVSAAVARLEARLGESLPEGFSSEVCLWLEPWLQSVLACIEIGGLLLIDYGLPRRDYYRADRADGTLICHYRQRAHGDPLLWPGLQDISAWVDFSAVAEIGRAAGCELAGYTTQAQFLLESIAGDAWLAARAPDPAAASALKTLVLPGEMGEHFKLIWLTRGFADNGLPGRDFRDWL
jgi:SAM-dependent MidA family methyltransferase